MDYKALKIFGIPVYTKIPYDLGDSYRQMCREKFIPFLRIGLCISFVVTAVEIFSTYFYHEDQTFLGMMSVSAGFDLFLLALTFLSVGKKFVHVLGVVAISGAVYYMAFLASNIPGGFQYYWAAFFVPLQLIPLMTSFMAGLATLWLSVAIIFQFSAQIQVSAADMALITDILVYYGGMVLILTYLASQYRRHSFLMEKSLEQARWEAEEASRAKSTFLATMSHEVRTPLNGILGIVALLKDTRLDAHQKEYVETIRYSGDTLLTILNDILDFSKIEAGKFDLEYIVFNPERLIKSVVSLMGSRAREKNLEFNYSIEGPVPSHLRSDPTRLRQVLLNLVSNAIKFTDQGRVHIKVSCLNESTPERALRFEVSDTGIGISEEAAQNLFKEFAQADSSVSRKYGGTGLGLSICKKIVELMDGHIDVSSVEGQGTTFHFYIPYEEVESQSDMTDLVMEGAELPAFGDMHVLVAEDNKINQTVIKGLLERVGLRVDIANNGLEAVNMLKDGTQHYDFILMDMQMPEMDGITAAAAIRDLQNDNNVLPIIALTANSSRGDQQRCLAAGMNGFVSKPIDPSALYAAIEQYTQTQEDMTATKPKKEEAPSLEEAKPRDVSLIFNKTTEADYSYLVQIEQTMGTGYVKSFAEDGLREISDLIGLVQGERDLLAIRRAAHDLRGLSNLFGLSDVEAIAEGIEICCVEDNMDEALILGSMLQEQYHNNVSVLKETYLASMSSH